jgi:hypothetical protein
VREGRRAWAVLLLVRLRPLLRGGERVRREGWKAWKVLPLVRLRPLLRGGGVREGRRTWKVEGGVGRRQLQWKGRRAEERRA